jgi:hypothetical protein
MADNTFFEGSQLMSDLSLPFWVLVDRDGESAPTAFSTKDKLMDFLDHESGRWKISLIADREGLVLAIADIHQQGATAVWLDPVANASPEDSVPLVDLCELSTRLNAA